MNLRRFARRCASAVVLAGLGMSIEGAAQAQPGAPLPGIGSGSPTQAAPAAPLTTLPPSDPAPRYAAPDDGLGVAPAQPGLIPNAVAPAMPAPMGAAPAAPCAACAGAGGFDWTRVPPVPVLPRPGFFTVFPSGPGYYTGLDCLLGNEREKPPAYPYVRFCLNAFPFFDYSFAYLDKPGNTETDPLDPLKRIHIGDDFLLSIGGEFRYRHLGSTEFLGNAGGKSNYIDQLRTRLFADFWFQDLFRVYVEGIDARVNAFDYGLVPGPNDQDHLDLYCAFIDVKIPFLDEGTNRNSYARVGRQELCYGSQRLVSPVEFGNVRVNFQGAKAFSRGEQFDIDAFVVNPVTHVVDKFDSVDDKQLFIGSWLTYRPTKTQAAELYYLNLSNANQTFVGQNKVKGGMDVNTFGSRYSGMYENFLFDFEGMYQFGTYSNQTTSAGATVADVGYQFKGLPMLPQFWLGYEWASGGSNTGTKHNTFNQLFAFGHYYFGQVDVVGRSNINDVFGQFVFFPSNWITVNTQYHMFYLDNSRDSLYNAAGNAIRTSANGSAGTNVGKELDFLVNFHLTNHQDIQFAYSHFFSGSFMDRTGNGKDIDYGYVQYTFRF